MLKKRTIAIESAISASSGSSTDDTAAIADAPQIAVPTPTSVWIIRSSRSRRPASGARTKATAMVPSVTGSVPRPVCATVASERVKPETTIAAWSTERAEKARPGRRLAGSGSTARIATPSTIAKTGAPTSGAARAQSTAASATATALRSPGITLRRDVRFGNLVHPGIADAMTQVRPREVHVFRAGELDPPDGGAFERLLDDRR